MAQESAGQTLQATALVHEAWLRMVGDGDRSWQNRAHFFGAASEAMRRILIERARRKSSLKHGGGKERLGRISKMDDKYLRRLLVVGMTSLVRRAKYKPEAVDRWLAALLSRKPARVVTVALANKAARVIWAIMARGGIYRAPQPAGAAVA